MKLKQWNEIFLSWKQERKSVLQHFFFFLERIVAYHQQSLGQ